MAQNYYRIATLLIDFGSKILTEYLEYHCAYKDLQDLLNGQKHNLHHSSYPEHNGNCCCNPKIKVERYKITKAQFDALFDNVGALPPCGRSGTHYCYFKPKTPITLDITLARLLIVNTIPTLSTTDSAAVDEIRKLRNFVAHSAETSISDQEFELKWCASRDNILHLARTLPQPFATEMKNDIDGLKTKSIDSSECMRLLEVVRNIRETDSLLEEMKSEVQGMKEEVHGIKGEVHEMKDVVHDVKSEVQGAKGAILENKDKVQEVKSEVHEMKGKVQDIKDEVHGVKGAILDNKDEVQEVKNEIHQVKDEVKCLRKDVQQMESNVLYHRANPDEIYTTGIHREPRLKQLIENTAMMLQKHRKKMYVSHKRAMEASYEGLYKDRHITITGRGGEGKTSLGKELMDKVCNEQTDDEQRYTPVILDKADDFDLINGKDHLVILIDDPFGKSNTNNKLLEEWERRFEKMSSFIEEGKILIIICIRLSILKDCDDKLSGVEFLRKEKNINLSGIFQLRSDEKYNMLKAYEQARSSDSTGANKINDSILRKVSESDPSLGFPHSCHLFFSSKNISGNILDFFNHPGRSLQKEIYEVERSDPTQYLMLVFMLLEGGEVNLNKLDKEKLKKLCELTKMHSVDVREIINCALLGSVYIEQVDTRQKSNTYKFTHQTILESVLLSFCSANPEIFLQLGKDDQIFEFARPAKYKREPGEVCVHLPGSCQWQLEKRILSTDGGLDILVNRRLYTDRSFVKNVFDTIETENINLFTKAKLSYVFRLPIDKAYNDLLHFFEALCKRFAEYIIRPSEESATAKQSFGKLKLPVGMFIDILNFILEAGKVAVVEKLLDNCGLDLHLRFDCKRNTYNDVGVPHTRQSDILYHSLSVEDNFLIYCYGNPVCYACLKSYKNLSLRLIDRMETVNLDNVTRRLLMYILTERDWPDGLQRLISKNRKVLGHIGLKNLIFHAAKSRSKSSVLYFLEFDKDLTSYDENNKTLLHYCCENDWVDVFCKIYREDNSIVNKLDMSQSELLCHAARFKSKQMVLHFLQNDIDVTECDQYGKTLFSYCCAYDWADVFVKVLEKDEDLLNKLDLSPSQVILYAAVERGENMVAHLLRYDIDFTMMDGNGKTLLHHCCDNNWIGLLTKF